MVAPDVGLRPLPAAVPAPLRRLVEEGRLAAAVDAAADLLDDVHDAELEAWVLLLRHEAAIQAAADAPLERPVAPGDEFPGADGAEDPFPGATGLVEVDAAALEPDLLAGALRHHGALVVRGLLAGDQADRLRARAEEGLVLQERWRTALAAGEDPRSFAPHSAFTPFAPLDAPPSRPDELARQRQLRTTWLSLLNSPRGAHEAVRALEASGLRAVITGLLGARPALIPPKWTLRRSSRGEAIGWHQEHHVYRASTQVVNVWTALTRCGDVAPGLTVVPAPRPGLVDWRPTKAAPYGMTREQVAAAAPGVEPVTPLLEAGDAVLLDDLTLHRTHTLRTMEEVRFNMEAWFFLPASVPAKYPPALF